MLLQLPLEHALVSSADRDHLPRRWDGGKDACSLSSEEAPGGARLRVSHRSRYRLTEDAKCAGCGALSGRRVH